MVITHTDEGRFWADPDIERDLPPAARYNDKDRWTALPGHTGANFAYYSDRQPNRGGRPPKDPHQRSIALDLWKEGAGQTGIVQHLAILFGDHKGAKRDTVKKWLRDFRENDHKHPLDDPLDFGHHEMIGLENEDLGFIKGIETLVERYSHRVGLGSPLKARQAKWCLMLSKYEPDLKTNPIDIYVLGNLIAVREQEASRFGGERLRTLDVKTFLDFRPWKNNERLRQYIAAVDSGKKPKLRMGSEDFAWYQYIIAKLRSNPDNRRAEASPYVVKKSFEAVEKDYWFELPSKRIERIIRRLAQ